MKIYILSFFLFLSCLNKENQTKTQENKTKIKTVNIKTKNNIIGKDSIVGLKTEYNNDTTVVFLKKLNYKLLDVSYIDTEKRILFIQKDNVIIHKINLLTQDDYDGFAVNWIKDIDDGFEISIELGKYYYERNFQFIFENNSFFLKKIETKSIDYKNNKEKESIKIINSSVNVDAFDINSFIMADLNSSNTTDNQTH